MKKDQEEKEREKKWKTEIEKEAVEDYLKFKRRLNNSAVQYLEWSFNTNNFDDERFQDVKEMMECLAKGHTFGEQMGDWLGFKCEWHGEESREDLLMWGPTMDYTKCNNCWKEWKDICWKCYKGEGIPNVYFIAEEKDS